jgi:hypothetical protein
MKRGVFDWILALVMLALGVFCALGWLRAGGVRLSCTERTEGGAR